MKIYSISNDFLKVQLEGVGGNFHSIQSADCHEYLWQGNKEFWVRRDAILFPFVGRLLDGKYVFEGKTYEIEIHGFTKKTEFSIFSQKEDEIILEMKSDEATRAVYPFEFSFKVRYKLVGNVIKITYFVENTGESTMYFGLGGHPGFNVPMDESLSFEDFYLEFKDVEEARKVVLSEKCLVTDFDEEFPLIEGKKLPLCHKMFDNDAIVLKNICRELAIKSDKSQRQVKVRFPQMPYLGLWHACKTQAPYVCIEPWLSLPAKDEKITVLNEKEDFVTLKSKEIYELSWEVEII